MFDKDVSHLQRSISGIALYPALCAGLTSYALTELTSGNVIYSVLCAGLISYALAALTLHFVPL